MFNLFQQVSRQGILVHQLWHQFSWREPWQGSSWQNQGCCDADVPAPHTAPTPIPIHVQFEAQEAARRAGSAPVAVDPSPLREALAALPGHNFCVGEYA